LRKIILLYHSVGERLREDRMRLRVDQEDFHKQLEWLRRNGWSILPVNQLREQGKSPAKRVAISFDDGYEDQLKAAEDLKVYGVRGTFFLIPGLGGPASGDGSYYRQWRLMDAACRAELRKQGHEIGGHSHRHPGPLTLESADRSREEVERCLQALRQEGVTGPVGFSYPHGAQSRRIREQVRDAGFVYACGSRPGPLSSSGNPFHLPRIEIRGGDSLEEFKRKVEGRGEGWRMLRHFLAHFLWKVQGRI
jgi:peptidoglycan/xylan/chitin deacetylase (PgdA/CDA1 family)